MRRKTTLIAVVDGTDRYQELVFFREGWRIVVARDWPCLADRQSLPWHLCRMQVERAAKRYTREELHKQPLLVSTDWAILPRRAA